MGPQRFGEGRLTAAARNALKGERGTYVVEFAVVALVLFFMMFMIIEFGRAIWVYNSIAHGAREGTRYAIVRGAESGRAATPTEVQTYVRGRAGVPAILVTTTWEPDNQPGSVVQVRVRYDFQPLAFGTMLPTMALSSTSRMVISF